MLVDEERGCVEGRLAETDEVAADAAVDDPLLRDLTQLAVHVEHANPCKKGRTTNIPPLVGISRNRSVLLVCKI